MKTEIFAHNKDYRIEIKTITSKLITGDFRINSPDGEHIFEINCGCCQISDTDYKLFFQINWDKIDSTQTYTVFAGQLTLGKYHKANLNLKWVLVNRNDSSPCKTGAMELTNQTSIPYDYWNESINTPYPLGGL